MTAPHQQAYGQMCALISLGRSLAPKGRYCLTRAEVETAVPDCLATFYVGHQTSEEAAGRFADYFGNRGLLGVNLLRDGFDAERLATCWASFWPKPSLNWIASKGMLIGSRVLGG